MAESPQARGDDDGGAALVCVAIPAYRSPRLRDCLRSLTAIVADGIPFEVRIVLNDATPEVRAIAAGFESDRFRCIEMPANLGIAGGLNAGFAASDAPFLLGLQDDAIVEPGWMPPLLERIATAPDIGAVGGLTLDSHGRVWDAGWVVWRDGITSPVWLNGSRDPADHAVSRAIAQHGSAGLLMRRAAWESIGGCDDAYYPAYYSDVDICVSLRRRGWRVIFEPRSRMRHAINSSSTPPYIEFLLERNRRKFLSKHEPFLAGMPDRSDDPAAIAAAAAEIARTPQGAEPPPPTTEDLALLRSRLDRPAELVLRWERDVLWDYARHLERAWEGTRVAHEQVEARLRDVEAHRRETEASLASALVERDRALVERDRIWHELDAIASSSGWRSVSALRAVKARLARVRLPGRR